jgi:peptide/nickel transport system ATP-binding protein
MDNLEVTSHGQVFGTRNPTFALDGVSFVSCQAEYCKPGGKASGKSTITCIILGLLRPTEGCVIYKSADIFIKISLAKQFRREVQVVFQNPYSVYNPVYKVDRVLMKPIQKKSVSLMGRCSDLIRIAARVIFAGMC